MAEKYILTKVGNQVKIALSDGKYSRTMSPPFNTKLGSISDADSLYTVEVKDSIGDKINLSTINILTIGGVAPDNSNSNAFFQQVVSFFPDASTSGGVEAFSKEFIISDWIDNNPLYSIFITSNEHQKSTISSIIIYKNNGGNYEEVYVESKIVDAFMGVEINVLYSPDMRFDGRVVIL